MKNVGQGQGYTCQMQPQSVSRYHLPGAKSRLRSLCLPMYKVYLTPYGPSILFALQRPLALDPGTCITTPPRCDNLVTMVLASPDARSDTRFNV